MLEENTTTYWNVYYAPYLILRVLVSSVLLIVLVFLIKVYHRIRKGRSLMIHKQEAL